MPYTNKKIRRLLVANRGEIAVRIIQATQELNIEALALYSDADKGNLATQLADESFHIGSSMATKSYLDMDKILKVAIDAKVDAIHPGYGFLAENSVFAKKIEDAGIIFIGPSSDIIKQMGDKANAIARAKQALVPTIPGSEVLKNLDEALVEAKKIGYPIALKAVAGGGGKGIRIIENEEKLKEQFPIVMNEAKSAFGNPDVYLETYIPKGRHIEVQILGDGENCIHLYDRECSIQRRRQKVLEEAPSNALDAKTRQHICSSALNLAKLVKYKGAGTLEFLYDEDKDKFYFLEMNTRIQVEHGITEMITGIDIVREMIKIADGSKLSIKQEDVKIRGHAIEIRVNAEDPYNNFFPSPGEVTDFRIPTGFGIRVDTNLFNGRIVPPFYDSLVAKLMVYDTNRSYAITRMQRALKQIKVKGINTTLPLFQDLFKDDDFKNGNYHINFLESWISKNQKKD